MVTTSVESVESVPSSTPRSPGRTVQHFPALVGYVARIDGEVVSNGRPIFQTQTRSTCSSQSLRVVQPARIADAAPDQGQSDHCLWRRVYVSHRRCEGCVLQHQ